jgi:hypothetical protein
MILNQIYYLNFKYVSLEVAGNTSILPVRIHCAGKITSVDDNNKMDFRVTGWSID